MTRIIFTYGLISGLVIILSSLAVIITALAAVTGIKPKGTQHLARTRMMTVARIALLVLLLLGLVGYFVARSRSRG